MATKKKTSKKTTKKVTKKVDIEENLPALQEAGLNSASLAEFANYDLAEFADINLDVVDNKELFKNDFLIPKIWLIQSMSELRKEKKADEGQFVDSQTGEILADLDETLKFVVIKTFKRWHTFKMVGDKKEFVSSEIMTLENANLAYQETIEGVDYTRRQVISAYVLIERDAIRGINKPYIIDFASTSKYAGRKMISDIKTLNDRGYPAFVGFFNMTSHEESFERGDAFVKDIQFGGFLPKTAMPFLVDCWHHLESIQDQIEIDDRDVINSEATNKADTNVNEKASKTSAGI
jgi:hypothetical protein